MSSPKKTHTPLRLILYFWSISQMHLWMWLLSCLLFLIFKRGTHQEVVENKHHPSGQDVNLPDLYVRIRKLYGSLYKTYARKQNQSRVSRYLPPLSLTFPKAPMPRFFPKIYCPICTGACSIVPNLRYISIQTLRTLFSEISTLQLSPIDGTAATSFQ